MSKAEWPFISKVILSGEMRDAVNAGVSPLWFESEQYGEIWGWMLNYYRTYNQVPSQDAFRRQWAGKAFANVNRESMSGLLDELREFFRRDIFTTAIDESLKMADDGDIPASIGRLAQMVRDTELVHSRSHDSDYASTMDERLAEYEERAKTPGAIRGAPTGFTGLDFATGGLQPGQLNSFIGMPKAGKTQTMLHMARTCYEFGLPVLYYTYEMPAIECQERLDAMYIGVNPNAIRRGELTEPELRRYKKHRAQHSGMADMLVFVEDMSFGTSVDNVIAKIQQHEPKVVFIDGVYMMSEDLGMVHKSREEKLSYIVQRLRNMTQEFGISMAASSQGSEKVGGGRMTGEKVMYTQAFSQYSTNLIGVERTGDTGEITTLRTVHSRNSRSGFEFNLEWDWDTSSFTELHAKDMDDDDD